MHIHPRHFSWFAATAALSAVAFAGCSTSPNDSSESTDESAPAAELSAPRSARLERWRALFPQALAASGAALRAEPGSARLLVASPRAVVELPASADGAVALTDSRSGMKIAFALEGASSAPLGLDGDLAAYKAGGPRGADVLHRPAENGTEDFVAFEARPPSERLVYSVEVGAVAGLRLVGRTLEFLDGKGSPRLRVAPPFVIDSRGAARSAEIDVEGCAVSRDPRPPWGRPVVPPGAARCAVVVRWESRGLSYPLLVDPTWETTDSLVEARTQAAVAEVSPASLSSLVLFTGGFNSTAAGGVALASAEIYYPLERAFAKTGDMQVARAAHTATPLADGTILVAGGLPDPKTMPPSDALTSMERFDPASGKFTSIAPTLSPGRALHTATTLADGAILFAGGTAILGQPVNNAALFDPINLAFTSMIPLKAVQGRAAHTATRLRSGKVLLAGGYVQAKSALLSAELFNPQTDAFEDITALGVGLKIQMTKARAFHTATRVDCRTVLIAGGTNNVAGGVTDSTAELWLDDENPLADAECPTVVAGTVRGFSSQILSMTAARYHHTATRLPTGDVLLVAGNNGATDLSSTELFKLSPPSFSAFLDLGAGNERLDQSALLVNGGASDAAGRGVLVAGGAKGTAALKSALVLTTKLGEACAQGQECLSGFCVDGVCCDTACGAECYSCLAAQQAPKDMTNPNDPGPTTGRCRAEKESAPPAGESITQGQLYTGELPTECNTLSEVHYKCDGKGVKKEAESFPCLPSACGATKEFCELTCNCNSMEECSMKVPPKTCFAKGWCKIPDGEEEGECQNKGNLGAPCDNDYECSAGSFCVDNVCCNSKCTDQCAACNLPSSPGTCSPVGANGDAQPILGGPAAREACKGDGTPCSGVCQGSKTNACVYPGQEKEFSSAVCACADEACVIGPAVLTRYVCDGEGDKKELPSNCGATTDNSDGGLRCGIPVEGLPTASFCLQKCEADKDCFQDYFCDGKGQCNPLPSGGRCDEAGENVLEPGGKVTPCEKYVCKLDADGISGGCLTKCESKADCLGELSCDIDGACVAEAPPLAETPSCSVSSAPGEERRGSAIALLALGALALAGARRRRG